MEASKGLGKNSEATDQFLKPGYNFRIRIETGAISKKFGSDQPEPEVFGKIPERTIRGLRNLEKVLER